MKLDALTTVGQLEGFLSGTQALAFAVISDNLAAEQLQKARQKLFKKIHGPT